MAETKNYFVKYNLNADASGLNTTLSTLARTAQTVSEQVGTLKKALETGFSKQSAFDNMVKNYNAAIDKIQKKNPFSVPVGASLKESAFTAMQKQLDGYSFNALVGARFREESLTALQTQLNGKTYTVNVEANIVGVKNPTKGSNATAKITSQGNINADTGKNLNSFARSVSKVQEAAAKGNKYAFNVKANGNFDTQANSLKTTAAALTKLSKLTNDAFKYKVTLTGVDPAVRKITTLQTAIQTLKASLENPFYVDVRTGTGAKTIKGAGKAAASQIQTLPVQPEVPPGTKPVPLEGEVTNVVNALAKSVGTVGVEGMVNFVKAAKTVVGEIGGLQGIISFVKGAKGVAGEIGGLQGIIGSVKAAQSVAGEIGGISGIVSSVKAAATVAGEVSGLQGIISTIKADGVKGGPIPIEGKLDSAAIIEQAKLIKLPPIPMSIKLGWGTEEQSKQSQIKSLRDKLKPLPMAVELDITKAKAKLDELKAHANKMNPLKLSAQVTGGKSGASNTTQATTSGKNALTPANIGRETAKAVGMSPTDTYTRFRKWAYPFTGNTSFGASTPAAISMAKGMGMMFAVSGLMSTVTNAFTQASEYENVMKTVKAILATNDTSGGFAGRYAAMENTIRKVGRETKFTAPEVAGAARFMAMAGLGTEDINAASMPIANLALVGDNDLSTTADKMTNIMTSFGLLKGLSSGQKRANMVHTSDVLTNTFTKSNTDLIQLAEAMQYAGPMSHLTGTSLEDAAAMVGVMGNAGIQSSMAGTTLRMMYQNIIKPNKKQLAEWDRLGIQRTDSNGRVRDIFEILKDLRARITGTKDLNAKIDKDALKTMGAEVMSLFRTTAGAGTAALLENLGEAINLAKSNREANGVAQNIADEKKNTIQGLWAQVTSTFTDQNVSTVSEFTNTIKEMLRDLRDWLQTTEAAETLKSIYEMAKSILDVFKWVAKAWKGIYNFAPGLIKLFIQAQFLATQLGYLINPFVQLTGVVSSLGAAINKFFRISGGASAAKKTLHKKAALATAASNGAATASHSTVPPIIPIPVSSAINPKKLKIQQQLSSSILVSRANSQGRLSVGNAFRSMGTMIGAGYASGSFNNLAASARTGFNSLVLGFGKMLGMLVSPLGMTVAGLTSLGVITYKIIDNFREYNKQTKKAIEYGERLNKDYSVINDKIYKDAAFIGGFDIVNVGYQKKTENTNTTYSLADQVVEQISKETSKLAGSKIIENYVGKYEKFLPNNIISKYYAFNPDEIEESYYGDTQTSNITSIKTINEKATKNAQKIAMITQWTKMAIEQEDVRQAEQDIRMARFKGDTRKVNEILSAFSVKTNRSMQSVGDAASIGKIGDPTKYLEWQYAQFKYLSDIAKETGPLQEFNNAMKQLKAFNANQKVSVSQIMPLAHNFLRAVPLNYNGTMTNLKFDKFGNVDWVKMADTLNNGIPLSIQQQQDIMGSLYKELFSNSALGAMPNIVNVLKDIYQRVANITPTLTNNFNNMGSFTFGKQRNRQFFGDETAENVARMLQNGIDDKGKFLTPKQIKNLKNWMVKNGYETMIPGYAAKTTDTITPPPSDQSAYDSKYNRSAARPTQIIFNIDQLCRFDNMKIAEGAEKKDLLEAMGEKITMTIQEIFNQAASELAIVGNT